MKIFLLMILTGLFVGSANAQVSFSTIDSKLKIVKGAGATEVICENPTMSINFQLKRDVATMPQDNFLTIDKQVIQITPLKYSGYKNSVANLSIDDQKQLLNVYSKYELDYIKNELKTQITNSSNQWVTIKQKGWLIWYFRVDNVPVQVDKKIQIQLFASTIIADKILTINAPVLSDEVFTKAGLIVNDMMTTLSIVK